jgi:hypothetical protein
LSDFASWTDAEVRHEEGVALNGEQVDGGEQLYD